MGFVKFGLYVIIGLFSILLKNLEYCVFEKTVAGTFAPRGQGFKYSDYRCISISVRQKETSRYANIGN